MNSFESYRKHTYDGEMVAAGHFNDQEKLELVQQGYKLYKNSKNKARQPVNKNGILITG